MSALKYLLLSGLVAFNGLVFVSASNTEKKDKVVQPGTNIVQEVSVAGPQTEEEAEIKTRVSATDSILLNNDILAFYGHPVAKNMGILGRYPKEELEKKLTDLANEYKAESGGRNIKKAFYIIYATAQGKPRIPLLDSEGNEVKDDKGNVKKVEVDFKSPSQSVLTIDQINKALLTSWIEWAQERDMLIFLDHQIGLLDPVESLKTMFKYLKYPNVHLALDPEWRTAKPMKEFGSVSAEEINAAQEAMQNYMTENNIQGERMLVIHQFREVMIKNRKNVKSDFEHVRLVHCMDGVGTPAEKLDTYKFNAQATNMPIKAFKLFYDFKLPGVLVDTPLLTPKQVYSLNPRPYIIMYQ
ncbi:MAG: hypothetical protein Ta2F_07040 [Termitinemataceae bacterium]|nr:MAG: hypothetical protein Ta2F_07040 [Termitinemataceae bacterium]